MYTIIEIYLYDNDSNIPQLKLITKEFLMLANIIF